MIKKICALALGLIACTRQPPQYPDPFKDLENISYSNGLDYFERERYYYADEGIQYLPYDVLASLKRPADIGLYDELFLERPERLGLYKNILNPNMPPIGITISNDRDYVPMAGINCATCHTSIITYNGKAIVVDGASSLFAIDRFIQEMLFSVAFTLINPIEFESFFQRYKNRVKCGVADSSEELNKLSSKEEFKKIKGYLERINSLSEAETQELQANIGKITSLTTGAYPTYDKLDTRLEMFKYLVTRLKFFLKRASYAKNPSDNVAPQGLGRSNPWGVTKNMLAAELMGKKEKDWPKQVGGPLNTPTIWEFDSSKWIFISGITNSMLERNLAQGIALLTDFNWQTYETTVSIRKLEHVSSFSRRIESPQWPEELFGKINEEVAHLGKDLYAKYCLGCHRNDTPNGTASIEYSYMDVGTDPEYYKAQAEDFYGKDLFSEVLSPFLIKVKEAGAKREKIKDLAVFEVGRLPSIWRKPKFNAYEAKPLLGIWASPPYLHNGSVPSIRELLTNPKFRVTGFWMGDMEYDPIDLGFKYKKLPYSTEIQTNCIKCVGSSNQGHNYGTNLSIWEKNQLIEYIKSL